MLFYHSLTSTIHKTIFTLSLPIFCKWFPTIICTCSSNNNNNWMWLLLCKNRPSEQLNYTFIIYHMVYASLRLLYSLLKYGSTRNKPLVWILRSFFSLVLTTFASCLFNLFGCQFLFIKCGVILIRINMNI